MRLLQEEVDRPDRCDRDDITSSMRTGLSSPK